MSQGVYYTDTHTHTHTWSRTSSTSGANAKQKILHSSVSALAAGDNPCSCVFEYVSHMLALKTPRSFVESCSVIGALSEVRSVTTRVQSVHTDANLSSVIRIQTTDHSLTLLTYVRTYARTHAGERKVQHQHHGSSFIVAEVSALLQLSLSSRVAH